MSRRLQFSFGRFALRLGRGRVHIAEVPGTRGTADKSCRVHVQFPGLDRVATQRRRTLDPATIAVFVVRLLLWILVFGFVAAPVLISLSNRQISGYRRTRAQSQNSGTMLAAGRPSWNRLKERSRP